MLRRLSVAACSLAAAQGQFRGLRNSGIDVSHGAGQLPVVVTDSSWNASFTADDFHAFEKWRASSSHETKKQKNHSTTGAPGPGGQTGHGKGGHGKDTEAWLQPYLRYLWWVVVAYMFWAQAEVCDEYFVPVIELISDRFRIPEDVAGATIMALGCNGPELFINTVSIFKASDLGLGAVVGGEVFNLLVLCGCSIIATPAVFMPLPIAKFSFTRDILFYALSIGLLYWALYDGYVHLVEALVLLGSGVVYSTTVALSSRINRRMKRMMGKPERQPSEVMTGTPSCTFQGQGTEGLPLGPYNGAVLGVREYLDNRMQDRFRHWDPRYMRLKGAEGLLVSTDVIPGGLGGRTARGIAYKHDAVGAGGHWTYGGLVNAPMTIPATPAGGAGGVRRNSLLLAAGSTRSFGVNDEMTVTESTWERATSDPGDVAAEKRLELEDHGAAGMPARSNSDPVAQGTAYRPEDNFWELIPRVDFVACIPSSNLQSPVFELQVLQRDMGKVVRLELDAHTVEERDQWVKAIGEEMVDMMKMPASELPKEGEGMTTRRKHKLLKEWLDWIRFPVQFFLRATIPDVRQASQRKWYPISFIMSMVWLATFSFGVVEVCDILSDEFNISVTILGFTVAAIGTSFPNVISCIAVSKQGRTSMAIANALGANIQNVFLALALPWVVQASLQGSFLVTSGNITTSVVAMFVTLFLLVLMVILAKCTMPKWAGWIFLLLYVVYLTITLGEEATGDDWWPFPALPF